MAIHNVVFAISDCLTWVVLITIIYMLRVYIKRFYQLHGFMLDWLDKVDSIADKSREQQDMLTKLTLDTKSLEDSVKKMTGMFCSNSPNSPMCLSEKRCPYCKYQKEE